MIESAGDKGINRNAVSVSKDSGAVYTLAHVLEREFGELHQGDPQKVTHKALGQDRTTVIEAKQQQPLADPSLSSQQPDIDPGAPALRKLWESVHGLAGDGRTALCLSGGGVRSAAFNLGVLQGLARLELLNQFHYLSTVSGGGYIGCWLCAWRYRCEKGLSDVMRGLSWPDRIGDAEVPSRAPDAISNLRRATNYLTPVKGILSPDTWATITVVGRNLILNHLIIVPLIAALLLIVKVFDTAAHYDPLFDLWENWTKDLIGAWLPSWLAAQYLVSLLLPGVFVALGWIILSIARPSWDVRRPSPLINTIPPTATPYRESLAQIWAPRLGILSVLFGALIFALEAANDIPGPTVSSWNGSRFATFPIVGAVGALVAFVLALGVATVKGALCNFPKTAKWAVRYLGHVPELPAGPATVPTAGARAVFLLALSAFAAGGRADSLSVQAKSLLPCTC
jgi:Patatin-like phospholipase